MKPPPRTRTRSSHYKYNPEPEEVSQRSDKWQRAELVKLINALKSRSRAAGGNRDIDYDLLRKHVRRRSVSEIHSVVEDTKDKVISSVSSKLKKKNKLRKPVEVWTHLACAVAGSREEPISAAFSQTLIVSSTEPRTLKNCDPPRAIRPPTDKSSPGLRSNPRLPTQAEPRGANAEPRLLGRKAAPLTREKPSAPSRRRPPPTAGVTPAATKSVKTQRDQQTPDQLVTSISSSTAPCPVGSSAISSCSASASPATRPSTSAGPITAGDPRTPGVKHVVDFERIYGFLSVKPNVDCRLTPMESAVVLDLLMSLPEEFSMLDCNRLHKHLVQVYQRLSSPADSDPTWETLRSLQGGRQDRGAKTRQPGEAERRLSGNTISQSEEADVLGLCPPLNPFMLPLKLMKRRK